MVWRKPLLCCGAVTLQVVAPACLSQVLVGPAERGRCILAEATALTARSSRASDSITIATALKETTRHGTARTQRGGDNSNYSSHVDHVPRADNCGHRATPHASGATYDAPPHRRTLRSHVYTDHTDPVALRRARATLRFNWCTVFSYRLRERNSVLAAYLLPQAEAGAPDRSAPLPFTTYTLSLTTLPQAAATNISRLGREDARADREREREISIVE